ncbi:MAG: cadherin domain-containing protein [Cyclobacteriaceae bacterium]
MTVPKNRFFKASIIVTLSLFTTPLLFAQSSWNQLGADIDGSSGDGKGVSVALSSDGLTMATGAASSPDATLRGVVRVYTYSGSSWTQKGNDIAGEADGDSFGGAISLSDDGNIIAIAAFSKDLTSSFAPNGRVQVYEWNGSAWVQKGSDIDGVDDFENLGESVSLSGDGTRLAIGIPGEDTNGATAGGETGAVRVYEFSTNWTLLGAEIAGVEDLSAFGSSVSLDQTGTALAIGASAFANGGFSPVGQVTVYRYNGGSWEAKGSTLSTFTGTGNQVLGASVSLSNDGNRLAIGAPTDLFEISNIGFVQVWDYASESWTQVGSNIISSFDGDEFGKDLQLSGDGTHLIIGAAGFLTTDNDNGRSEIYTFNSTAWEQVGSSIVGEASEDNAGSAVAISSDGSVSAIGAFGNDGGGADAGHVRVYEFGVADNTPPSVAITSTLAGQTNASTIPITITFSEAVTGFELADITVGNGTASDLVNFSDITFTANITPSADGAVTVDIAAAVAQDLVGNDNTVATQFSITFDGSSPLFTSDTATDFAEGNTAVAYTAVATDFSTVTYSLGSVNDEALFNIDGSTGAVSFLATPDFESPTDPDENNAYVIEVIASDGLNANSTQTVTITVTNVNEDPVFTSTPITTINDNETYSYPITITDPDRDAITVTLENDNPSFLSIGSLANVTTLAGVAEVSGSADGQGTAASFFNPTGVAVDIQGNVFVADAFNHLIRKIDPSGNVTTLAGSGTRGSSNGQGTAASFFNPTGVAVDIQGNVFVVENGNHLIRKIDPSGNVTTLAGAGSEGSADGQGTAASFFNPFGIAVDSQGNVFVAEELNHLIRKIDPSGNVTTLAGTAGTVGSADGQGTAASFNSPAGVTVDSQGNVFVADFDNHLIRKIDPSGNVTTFAGKAGIVGSADGQGTAASFNSPAGVTVDSQGNVLVVENGNHLIRKIDPSGNVTTLAGAGTQGSADGQGTAASFTNPFGIAVDSQDNVFVADFDNHLIRKVNVSIALTGSPEGQAGDHPVTLIADDGNGGTATQSFTLTVNQINEAPIITTSQSFSVDENSANGTSVGTVVATDADAGTTFSGWMITAGNGDGVFAIDASSGEITVNDNSMLDFETTTSYTLTLTVSDGTDTSDPETITISVNDANDAPVFTSTPITNINGNDFYTYLISTSDPDGDEVTVTSDLIPSWLSLSRLDYLVENFVGSGNQGDVDGTGAEASFNFPGDIALDAEGNLYVTEVGTHKIKKITPEGVVSTFAGSGMAGDVDGPALTASFNTPSGLAFDADGNLYVADQFNYKVKVVTTEGNVETYAGTGVLGNNDGNVATATFGSVRDLAFDASGNLLIAEGIFDQVRSITPEGLVETLAQNVGFLPSGIAVGPQGNIFVASEFSNAVFKITPAGDAVLFAGSQEGFKDGTGAEAQFSAPTKIAIDEAGILYVTDTRNERVRSITPEGVVSTIAGNGKTGNFVGPALISTFQFPRGIALDDSGNIYISDNRNHVVKKMITNSLPALVGDPSTLASDEYDVELTADDGKGGSTSQDFTIIVVDDTRPNTIIFPADQDGRAIEIVSEAFDVFILFGNGETLVFDQVVGFEFADISVEGGSVSALIDDQIFAGFNNAWKATIVPDGTSETITISIPEGAVTDQSGNDNLAGAGSVSFDGVGPSVVVSTDVTDPTNANPIPVTITFSESVTGFILEDIGVINGVASNFQRVNATIFTADVAPSADGLVAVAVEANVVEDLAGNLNTGSEEFVFVNYDGTKPTASVENENITTNSTEAISLTITFSEDVTGFEIGDLSSDNTVSLSNFTPVNANTYTVEATYNTSADDNVVEISIPANSITDVAGNGNDLITLTTITFDFERPSVEIQGAPATTAEAFTLTFAFSEEVSGFEIGDITVSNGTAGDFKTVGSASYTTVITPANDLNEGASITVNIAADVATDAGGNGNTAATEVSVTYDLPYSGGSGTAGDPYLIGNEQDLRQLSASSADWSAHFRQTADISMSEAVWKPIGDASASFTGTYDGSFFRIDGLVANIDPILVPFLGAGIGLFGYAANATLKNIGLTSIDFNSTAEISLVGGLVALSDQITITNCYVTGEINLSKASHLGGLVGYELGDSYIIQSFSDVKIGLGGARAGGLVGTTINSSYIINSYALGDISEASNEIGGLVGQKFDDSGLEISIQNSYYVGKLGSANRTGGLVGGGSKIEVVNSFWDVELSGEQTSKGGGIGLTSAEMRGFTKFNEAGWDFKHENTNGTEDVWTYLWGYYPVLSWQIDNLKPFTISGKVVDENGNAFSAGSIKPGFESAVPLNSDGTFSLDLEGEAYILSVIPDDKDAYFETLYGNTNNVTRAKYAMYNQSGVIIKMIAKSQASLLDGNGRVSGRVVSAENDGGRIVQGRILDGNPLEGVTVYLVRTSDEEILTSVVTDENGDFEITGIPAGDYQLVLGVAGVDLNLEGSSFTMDEEGSDLTISAAVGEDGVSFAVQEVLGVADGLEILVYPNPVSDLLNVRVKGAAKVRVLDLSGQTIKEVSFTNETQIDVTGLKEGVHFIEVNNDQGRSIRKLVKSN